jgi:hypothetical protein
MYRMLGLINYPSVHGAKPIRLNISKCLSACSTCHSTSSASLTGLPASSTLYEGRRCSSEGTKLAIALDQLSNPVGQLRVDRFLG